jgi:hypothetical protein
MKWLLITVVFATIIGFSFIHKTKTEKKNISARGSYKSFALLELFTSEGCSSCPSADRLLPQLATIDSNIITLSFHVDYWNDLGWEDKFSSAEFTSRQREYGQQLKLESIYTPQLVINGEYELVGSNRSTAEADIRTVLKEKAKIQLKFDEVKKDGDKIKISCHADGELKDQNIFLALVQKHAETNVKAGENRGSKLSHTNVVRSLTKKSAQQKMDLEISFPKDLSDDNWSVVVFSQDKNDLKITGATRTTINGIK